MINERLKKIAKELRKDPENEELDKLYHSLHRKQFEEMQESGELDIVPALYRLVNSCPSDLTNRKYY